MKSNSHFAKLLFYVSVPFVMGMGLFFLFENQREKSRRSFCQSNLRELGKAFAQYALDYDGRLPPVKGSDHPTDPIVGNPPFGWADALQPHFKSITMFQCASDFYSPGVQILKGPYTDFWMNARLSGHKRGGRVGNLILLGDGVGDNRSTARYALAAPPTQTPTCDSDNRCQSAWKHLGGANFLFVDGHVKWLLPGQVTARKGDSATFAP